MVGGPLFIDRLLASKPDPDRIAMRWQGTAPGYVDQGRAAAWRKGFAQWLAQEGIQTGDRVVIVLPKGPSAALAVLGVFEVGAVAAILDVEAPHARVQGMVAALGAQIVVTHEALAQTLRPFSNRLLVVEPEDPGTLPVSSASLANKPTLHADSGALILMTSGSTGVPKGVVLSHGNLTTFIDWAIATFALSQDDRFISLAPLHFDLSVLDLYTSQMLGAEVFLVDAPATRLPGLVAAAALLARPTVIYMVPTQLRMLATLGFFSKSAGAKALRWVLSAGEVLANDLAAKVMKDVPGAKMANLYGPTETNVVACQILYKAPETDKGNVAIGTPCPHAQITLVPDTDQGELCVTGPSVMLGYTTSPENPPFQPAPRHFRTGDLMERSESGVLRFLGRKDNQIKLQGYRIELGEVEAALMQLPYISGAAAVVVDQSGSAPKMAACIVLKDSTLDTTEILRHLAGVLPRAALPKILISQRSLPQTSTGKIDRKALRDLIEDSQNVGH